MSAYQPSFSSFIPHNSLFADRELERRLTTFLSNHDGQAIRVGAAAGRVCLRGVVFSESRKRAIELLARRVAGVTRVVNELTVHQPRTAQRTAPARPQQSSVATAFAAADRWQTVATV